MRNLFPLESGKRVRFDRHTLGIYGSCQTHQLSVRGSEVLQVGETARDVWVIDWERRNCYWSPEVFVRRIWVDQHFAVILKSEASTPNQVWFHYYDVNALTYQATAIVVGDGR